MRDISLIWDVIFTGEGVLNRNTVDVMLVAMGSKVSVPIYEVQNWNTLHKGQKVARAGFTSGLRLLIDVSTEDVVEVLNLHDNLISFEHQFCATSTVSIAERLSPPLDPRTKARFPELGRIMLSVEFTNGLGYSDAAGIRAAMSNQTKDTKNGLDPTSTGRGSSGTLFSEGFRNLMYDSNWFRRFSTFEGINSATLKKAAMGGSYDFAFDLRDAITEIAEKSEGIWWEKLDTEILTLSPSLIVDPENLLESDYDPSNFYHLTKGKVDDSISMQEKLIENAVKIEMQQTGNSDHVEDMRYDFSRLIRGRRVRRQVGVKQGLAHGNENFIVSNHVIRPWLGDEFVNCLAFFLMSRKPKFWRNGKSTIRLIHPFSGELIEDLKETL